MFKKRSSVIIESEKKILLMRRVKKGKEYYTVPGGTIEKGETPEQTAVRELKEETNFDIVLGDKFAEFEDEKHHGHYFLAKSFKGNMALGGPEREKFCESNQYHLEWWPISDIEKLNLLPAEIKDAILANWDMSVHK